MHTAILPAGSIGFIEIPITTVKPSHYRINDSITLVHSVVLTYHHEITEPKNVHYQDKKQINNSSKINHFVL